MQGSTQMVAVSMTWYNFTAHINNCCRPRHTWTHTRSVLMCLAAEQNVSCNMDFNNCSSCEAEEISLACLSVVRTLAILFGIASNS